MQLIMKNKKKAPAAYSQHARYYDPFNNRSSLYNYQKDT
jgi:hypothetical protein